MDDLFQIAPWQTLRIFKEFAAKAGENFPIPQVNDKIAQHTADYEQYVRQLWQRAKENPTKTNILEFIEAMVTASEDTWRELYLDVLDLEELLPHHEQAMKKEVDQHIWYLQNSLYPDLLKEVGKGTDAFNRFDYRIIFMYSGALWSSGMLATVMFDGLEFRDLADLFLFSGPNDSETCTGPRGCDQHVGKIYTVAEILSQNIIPGKLQCYTNCRHMLMPIASPLNAEKHMSGKHNQKSHGRKTALTVYHGTTDAVLDSILRDGLIPGRGGGSDDWAEARGWSVQTIKVAGRELSVYVTASKFHAEMYAERLAEYKNAKPVVFAIEVDESVLIPDENDTQAYRIQSSIPSSQLKLQHKSRKLIYIGFAVTDSVSYKHMAGKHSQASHNPHKGSSSSGRVFNGEPIPWSGKKLTKLEVGEIGEQLAMRILSEQLGHPFSTLNEGVNNAPIDVAGDHVAVEVKTGLASNGKTAQHWRATIGQPGKAESELIAQMTKEEKRAHNQMKSDAILERKATMLAEMSAMAGSEVKGMTVGIILHPDGKRADVYQFDGFHLRIPWNKAEEVGTFMGSYNTDGVSLIKSMKHMPGKHSQKLHGHRYGKSISNFLSDDVISDVSNFFGADFGDVIMSSSGTFDNISSVTVEHDRLRIEGKIPPDGEYSWEVTIDGKAYLDVMRIPDSKQGQGIGRSITESIESAATKLGAKTLELDAQGAVGIYAWARLGFDYNNSYFAGQINQGAKATWMELYSNEKYPLSAKATAAELAKLKGPNDEAFGKEYLLSRHNVRVPMIKML